MHKDQYLSIYQHKKLHTTVMKLFIRMIAFGLFHFPLWFFYFQYILHTCNVKVIKLILFLPNDKKKWILLYRLLDLGVIGFVLLKLFYLWSRAFLKRPQNLKDLRMFQYLPIVLTLLSKNICFVKTGGRLFCFVAFS